MLKTKIGFSGVAALAASALFSGVSSNAQLPFTVYENPGDFETASRTDQGNAEIGDDITFIGTARTVTEFDLEYFITPDAAAIGQVKIYATDGGPTPQGALPGTLLFTSSPFLLEAANPNVSGFGKATFKDFTPFDVPDTVVWTLTITGLTGTDKAGLIFAGPAEIGTTADRFYQKSGTEWVINDTPLEFDGFAAKFTAVPEPSTWALLFGGLGALSFWARRRQS
jgi:PEP-CTERM motif